MKTVRLTLNRREISAIVPGLDHIVERLAARRGTHSSVMPFVESGKDIFAGKRYDRKMLPETVKNGSADNLLPLGVTCPRCARRRPSPGKGQNERGSTVFSSL